MKNVVTIGSVTVQRTLHVPQRMKGKSLQRFVDSKQFSKEKQKQTQGKVIEVDEENDKAKVLWADGSTSYITYSKLSNNSNKSGGIKAQTKMATATKKAASKKTATKAATKSAAKKGAAKKAAAKAAPKKAASKAVGTQAGDLKSTKEVAKAGGKIAQILELHKKGKTNAEIIAAGYSKSTVSIQVSKYKRGESTYA